MDRMEIAAALPVCIFQGLCYVAGSLFPLQVISDVAQMQPATGMHTFGFATPKELAN